MKNAPSQGLSDAIGQMGQQRVAHMEIMRIALGVAVQR